MAGIALLSSGLDSVVASTLAREELEMALTVDYGQKAAPREIQYSRKVSEILGLSHRVVELPWLRDISSSALTSGASVPQMSEEELNQEEATLRSARRVWVPNRNAVMVNVAASFAEAYGFDSLVVGFDAEEAATFPDNSSGFVVAVNRALSFSTLNGVKVRAPVIDLTKEEIVRLGVEKGAPLEWSWSCYYGGESPCLKCESCQRRARAFKGGRDPLLERLGL